MPPKGKWDICPEEKGRMSIMNKKVLGIAAAAAAAGGAVYAASKVKKQAQAQGTRREKESLQSRNYGDKQVYLVGGGLASMAAAAYLVRDANFDGHNIHILESMDVLGGSNDGADLIVGNTPKPNSQSVTWRSRSLMAAGESQFPRRQPCSHG